MIIDSMRFAAGTAALLLAASGAAPGAASGQQDFSDVRITTSPVAGAVSMLEGRGGNIGVSAGPDGLLIIDDQFEPLAARIRAALDALGSGGPRLLINTHWHGDHTGGNAVFGQDAVIVAQDNVRRRLLAPNEVLGTTAPPAPRAALPVLTFRESVTLHWNGEDVAVVHFPHGHTDGDSVIAFTGSRVAHLGDHLFAGRFPFVDLGSGGDVVGLTRNIEALLDVLPADWRLIPGHGPVSTVDDLRSFHRMLVETTRIVREDLATGADEQAVVAAGLPAEWDDWGKGFVSTERWLGIVVKSLRASPDGPDAAGTAAARDELAAALAAASAAGAARAEAPADGKARPAGGGR